MICPAGQAGLTLDYDPDRVALQRRHPIRFGGISIEHVTWVRTWDERIARWIEQGPKSDMGCAAIWRSYQGSGKTAINERAMPEPYVGDPLSDHLAGVALNLNPGAGIAPQLWPDGPLVAAVRQDGYLATYRKWSLAPETVKWWAARGRWLKRVVGGPQYRDLDVVGIDLFPWHSDSWGQFKPVGAGMRWLDANVLRPAASVARGTAFGALTQPSLGASAVVAVGKAFAALLDQLHFDILDEVDVKTGPRRFKDWPVKSPGTPTTRTIRVYRSTERKLVVLQTSAPGGNTLPRQAFDRIIREMLGIRA